MVLAWGVPWGYLPSFASMGDSSSALGFDRRVEFGLSGLFYIARMPGIGLSIPPFEAGIQQKHKNRWFCAEEEKA